MKHPLHMLALAALTLLSPSLAHSQALGNAYYDNATNSAKFDQLQPGLVYLQPYHPFPAVANKSNITKDLMTFNVRAMMNVKADTYTAVFNVTQVAPDIMTAETLMSERVSGFMKSLTLIGVDTSQVYVDMVSFVPVYDYSVEKRAFSKRYIEIPTGFEYQKNVMVTYKNSALLNKIMTAAVTNEIYDLVKVDYFIKDLAKLEEELRQQCVDYVNQKLKTFGQLGIALTEDWKRGLNENFQSVFPLARYESYQAFSRPSLKAARNKANDPAVAESPKPRTLFYNPVPTNDYDIVLNPKVSEPVVQLLYDFNATFIRVEKPVPPPTPEKPEKQYIILTPEGDAKVMPLN